MCDVVVGDIDLEGDIVVGDIDLEGDIELVGDVAVSDIVLVGDVVVGDIIYNNHRPSCRWGKNGCKQFSRRELIMPDGMLRHRLDDFI